MKILDRIKLIFNRNIDDYFKKETEYLYRW